MQDVALMDDDIRQMSNVNRSFHKLLTEEQAMSKHVESVGSRGAEGDDDAQRALQRRALRKLTNVRKKVK
jgi:hypothetical protein